MTTATIDLKKLTTKLAKAKRIMDSMSVYMNGIS